MFAQIQALNLSKHIFKNTEFGQTFFFSLLGHNMKALGKKKILGLGHSLGPNHGMAGKACKCLMGRVWG